jgi:hypothetical protein
MNGDAAPAANKRGIIQGARHTYQAQTGQSLALWMIVALLGFAAQIIFRREMQPGEFGTLNTALGMAGLMTLPVLAVHHSFRNYLATGQESRINSLRSTAFLATETFAWIWGVLCLLLVFLLLPLVNLPRFSLELFTLLNVLVVVGSTISGAGYERGNQLRFWALLLAAAALTRVIVGAGLTSQEPWAESGLAASFIAGLITLMPALKSREGNAAIRWAAMRAAWNADFLLVLGATLSVLLGIYLFTNADRIVAQSWFGVVSNNNMGLVNWPLFDSYQTAGLLARSILWGTQPLLWILFAHRAPLDRTRSGSLTFFWIYLGALLLATAAIGCLAQPLSRLFCGDGFQATARLVPSLAVTMIPLGLLQGLGIFALASRRYHECFVLGACGIGYTLLLYLAGRQPQLMPAYMFGGALISMMVVLFVGVARWGRRQP